jgi:hypothetical protein
MATGRATERDRDLDDWFAEPDEVLHQTHRELVRGEARAGVEAGSLERPAPPPVVDDDWLTADPRREQTRRPKVARFALAGAGMWLAMGALVVVVVAVALAVSGVFSNTKTATPPVSPGVSQTPTTTPAKTTTPKTTLRKRFVQPATTLKPGQTGAQVRLLQRALTTLGYRPGKIDGRYGPATQRAVIRFQQAEGLSADGVFGTKTKRALLHAAT